MDGAGAADLFFRYSHIALGAAALGGGLGAMAVKKGSRVHLFSGKIYFWNMLGSAALGATLGAKRGNIPAVIMGSLCLCSCLLGYRAVAARERKHWAKKNLAIVVFLTMLIGLTSTVWGLMSAHDGIYRIFMFSSGILAVAACIEEMRALLAPPAQKDRAWRHRMHMVNSYMIALTAFSATTLKFLPPWLQLTWPLALGTACLLFFERRRRHNMGFPEPVKTPQ